jgi:Kef-type K+ transport system membrane component KefB
MATDAGGQPGPADRTGSAWSAKVVAACIGLALVPILCTVAVLRFGSQLSAVNIAASPGLPLSGSVGGVAPNPFPKLLVALPVILTACFFMARLFNRIGQPGVIGEIFVGILLGPSLLGLVLPAGFLWLFPAYLTPVIDTLAQVGLIFFMFLIGYELNLTLARRNGLLAAAVSYASIAVPFVSGLLLAFVMYSSFASRNVSFTAFALFIAVSMSVTAFPVLARILADRDMTQGRLGTLSLTAAAVSDVVAWFLLAVVTAVVTSRALGGAARTLLLLAAFFAVLMWVVEPILARLAADDERGIRRVPDSAVLPVLLSGIMLSAVATNDMGIHPIFGAFLFGVAMPRDSGKIRHAVDQLRAVTTTLLLPLFFVYVGLSTKFGLLGASGRLWLWSLLIIGVAVTAKLVGTAGAARLTGMDWPDSVSIGFLMNCRGLTELIVLSVGLSIKVISPTVFAMLVLMTLAATVLTAPGLALADRFRGTAATQTALSPAPRREN